jgi:hypothetical protein
MSLKDSGYYHGRDKIMINKIDCKFGEVGKIRVISRNFLSLPVSYSLFCMQDKIRQTNFAMIFLYFLYSIISYPAFSQCSIIMPGATSLSHVQWDQILKKHVSSAGVVDYKSMRADKQLLQDYLTLLHKNPPQADWEKNEEMAYWINLYNASTVDLILQHYPVKSIQEIKNGKPWDERFIGVGDKKLSLSYIENEVLRKKFSDPRIHFAINCASKSCPALMNAAFTSDLLEAQLNKATKSFVNDTSRNRISLGKIVISEIFRWYSEDFTKSGNLISFLNKFSAVKISPEAEASYMKYDWSLNE